MVVVCSPDTVLYRGLLLAGFNKRRQEKSSRETNLDRFTSEFGSHPKVYAQIAYDLQTTKLSEVREGLKFDLDNFLMGIYFLKCYPTNAQQESRFCCCKKTAAKWAWHYAEKIQAMKKEKV